MTEDPHDTLAAEEFAIPAPDPRSPAAVPHDPSEPPHDTLAADEFAIPARDPHSPAAVPHDPLDSPHDTLAAEEFAIPTSSPAQSTPSVVRRAPLWPPARPLGAGVVLLALWWLSRRA